MNELHLLMLHQMRTLVERIPHREIESLELIAQMVERESPGNALAELMQALGTMVHATLLLWRGARAILESLVEQDAVRLALWEQAAHHSLNQLGALLKERPLQALQSIGSHESDQYDTFEMFGLYQIVPKFQEGDDDNGEGAGSTH